ncbi:MAG: signal peptidase II [Bacilli bacterium]
MIKEKFSKAAKDIKDNWIEFTLTMFLAVVLFVIDIVSKHVAYNAMHAEYEAKGFVALKTAVPYLFDVTLVFNNGAAWNMGAGLKPLLTGISLIMAFVIFFVLFLYFKKLPRFAKIGISLCLAGDVGNLIDRFGFLIEAEGIYNRGVVDFIVFDFWKSFPVFNIADSCLVIGIIVLIVGYIVVSIIQAKKANEVQQMHPEVGDNADLKEKLAQKSAIKNEDSSQEGEKDE